MCIPAKPFPCLFSAKPFLPIFRFRIRSIVLTLLHVERYSNTKMNSSTVQNPRWVSMSIFVSVLNLWSSRNDLNDFLFISSFLRLHLNILLKFESNFFACLCCLQEIQITVVVRCKNSDVVGCKLAIILFVLCFCSGIRMYISRMCCANSSPRWVSKSIFIPLC